MLRWVGVRRTCVGVGAGLACATGLWLANAGGGASASVGPSSQRAAASQQLNELFVLTADTGTLRKVRGAAHTFALTLSVRGSVAVFTDRPTRRAGVESMASLVANWKALGFAKSPPNAALELSHGSHSHDVKVFELRSPHFNARTGKLSFRAQDLGDRTSTALAGVLNNAHRDIPARFSRATLFIDSGSVAPITQFVKVTMTVPQNTTCPTDLCTATLTFDSGLLYLLSRTVISTATAQTTSQQAFGPFSATSGPVEFECGTGASILRCSTIGQVLLTPCAAEITGSADIDPGVSVMLNGIAIKAGRFSVPGKCK